MLVCRRRLKRDWEVLRQHFASRGGKPLLLVTLSPAEVLGQEKSRLRTPEQLHRIFYATRHLRRLDRLGVNFGITWAGRTPLTGGRKS